MKNNHHKKRKMVVSFLLLMSLVAILYSVSTQINKIEAHPDSTLKTKKEPMEEAIIHAGEDYEYKIPKDAIEKVEADLPEGYIQSSGFKYNFSKRSIQHIGDAGFRAYYQGDVDIDNGDKLRSFYFFGKERYHQVLRTKNTKENSNLSAEMNKEDIMVGAFPTSDRNKRYWMGPKKIFKKNNNQYWLLDSQYPVASPIIESNLYSLNDYSVSKNLVTSKPTISYPTSTGYVDEKTGNIYMSGVNNDLGKEKNPIHIEMYTLDSTGQFMKKERKHVPDWIPVMNYSLKGAPSIVTEYSGGYDLPAEGISKRTFDGGSIGVVNYEGHDRLPADYEVTQFVICKWDKDGSWEFSIPLGIEKQDPRVDVPIKIATEKTYYYFQNRNNDKDSRLKKIDLESISAEKGSILYPESNKQEDTINGITTVKIYPKGTKLQIEPLKDGKKGYFFYGYLSTLESEYAKEFLPFLEKSGTVIGQMDENFKVTNAQSIEANDYVNFSKFDVKSLKTDGSGGYVEVGGDMAATNFHTTGDTIPVGRKDAFWGKLNLIENHPPGIKISNHITENIDAIKTDQEWDQKLLQGINVTDNYDLWSGNKDRKTQVWLNNRINRNPLDPNINETDNTKRMSIDWSALGLTKTEAGPQRIKYFITDSSMQTTASSRWINKITNQTVQENEYALDAQNFSLKLDEVEAALNTEDAFKKRAKTMAWNSDSHEIDEDSVKDVFSEEKVTINQAQLKELRQAKIAKPYPVDVTYRPNNKTTLVNRVWVFVTNRTTIVDVNYVMYLDNYRLLLHEVATEDAEKIYTHSKVKVYKYNDTDSETVGEPALQADKTTPELLQLKQEEVQALQQATPENADREDAFPLTITFKDKEGKLVQGISHATVYHGKANLEIRFVDEDGSEIHQAINREEAVDSAIDLTQLNDIREATTMILSDGYELIEKPENETQFMLPKEGKTVTYIFKGKVTLKSVTKNMHFTTGKVSPFAQSLSYDGTETFKLSVTDQRGQKAPKEGYKRGQFSIQATLNQPFSKENTKHLKGAALIYEDGTETYEITSVGTEIYQSNQSQETKTYELMLDDKSKPNKGLRLYIPKGSNTETGTYTAEVTWELVEGP